MPAPMRRGQAKPQATESGRFLCGGNRPSESASYCGMEADLLSGGSSDAWSVGQLAPSPGLTRYSAFDLRVRGTRPFPIFAWPIPPSERYVQPTTTPRA